jgi:hypothetical protein
MMHTVAIVAVAARHPFGLQLRAAEVLHLQKGYSARRDQRRQFPQWGTALAKPIRGWRWLLHVGWKDMRIPFLVGATLDAIYQLIIHKFIYPLELLFTATLLALVPYFVLRGLARRFIGGNAETVDKDAGQ